MSQSRGYQCDACGTKSSQCDMGKYGRMYFWIDIKLNKY